MPNISSGQLAVQWYATRETREKPKPRKPVITSVHGVRRYWSDEEDALVLKTYAASGPRALAKAFGRKVKAVTSRATFLGLYVKEKDRR